MRVHIGIEENCDEKKKKKKGRNQRKEKKKGCANVRKKIKKAHTYNSMNTSVGVQNRVAIRRTIDSEKDTIEEMTRFS